MADDLRFARDVAAHGGTLCYRSDSYGADTALAPENGRVLAGGKRVLPPGVYGNGAYQVEDLEVAYDGECFTIHMKVAGADRISAETPAVGVSIRCLNAG